MLEKITLETALDMMDCLNSDNDSSIISLGCFAEEIAQVLYKALLDAPKNTIHNSEYKPALPQSCLNCSNRGVYCSQCNDLNKWA